MTTTCQNSNHRAEINLEASAIGLLDDADMPILSGSTLFHRAHNPLEGVRRLAGRVTRVEEIKVR